MAELNLSNPIGTSQDPTQVPVATGKPLDLTQPMQEDPGVSGSVAAGMFHGIDTFATTLDKLISPAVNKVLPKDWQVSNDALQSTYDSNTSNYEKIAKQHPYAAGIGNVAGQLIDAAPAFAIPGVEGAGISSLAGAAKLTAQLASNAAQNYVLGGLTTQKGQDPNQTFNTANAATQAAYSVPFSVAGNAVGNFLGKTTQLETAQNAAAQSGYTGKIMATDLPSQGIVDDFHKFIVNNVLNKLPGPLGTSSARVVQNQDVQDALNNYITGISGSTLQNSTTKIGNILDNHNQQLKDTYNQLWDNFTSQLPNTPMDRPNSLPILKDMLADPNQVQAMTTNKGGELQNLRQGLGSMTPDDIFRFKNDAWDIADRLQDKIDKGTATAGEVSLAQNAKSLYWNSVQDMQNAIGDNPSAIRDYATAKAFTVPYKNLFDPATRKPLVNAINDVNNQVGGVRDFINWTLNPNTTSGMVNDASKVLGQSGNQAVAGYGLRDLYNSSMDNVAGQPSFNVSKFLGGINQISGSNQKQLYQPSLDAMNGLLQVMKQNAAAVGTKPLPTAGGKLMDALSGAAPVVGGAIAAHAAASAPLGAAIAITPAVMSAIAKTSPLKNSLIYLNKAISDNPGASQYFLGAANKQINKLGFALTNDDNGNTLIHQPQ